MSYHGFPLSASSLKSVYLVWKRSTKIPGNKLFRFTKKKKKKKQNHLVNGKTLTSPPSKYTKTHNANEKKLRISQF